MSEGMKKVTVERTRMQIQRMVFHVPDDDHENTAIAIYQRATDDPYTGRTDWKYKVTSVEDVK
jgi:hypothetical protein